jgi:hypothetical protein
MDSRAAEIWSQPDRKGACPHGKLDVQIEN